MLLTFLEASVPLTKTYEKRPDGSYVGGAYPGSTNFTSTVEEITTCQQFGAALQKHADAGHCLLTNSLTRPIEQEPRRKLSDKNERRSWILLDIDGLEGITSAEQFIQKVLPAQFHDVSYIVQYSPSQGIKPGVRAHLYFMLYDSVDPRVIEAWLVEMNLTNSILSNQVTLSNSNLALSYPLDRVASRNGRIVYITPPECIGFDDPVEERIITTKKGSDFLSFNFSAMSPTEIARKVRERVNSMRANAGLRVSKKEDHVRVNAEGLEILDDSLVERGYVTSWMEDNDKFMRCNINGGDSYAYYYHRDTDNPYLHNFKGEPAIRLKLFDPEYFKDHVLPHYEKLRKGSARPFVFRDHESDKWFMGTRRDTEILVQPTPVGSQLKIDNYFSEHGTSPPAVIPTWDRMFDPTYFKQWNEDDKVFNTWRPTEYQRNTLRASSMPEICERVIRHVTGNDEETFHHFVNWLAFIQQSRTKPGTAWVLHGVPGTGKGLLYHYIITPIFGTDYCESKQLRDLKDRFNGWMEQCIFVNIDEANTDDVGHEGKEIINALKNWITEPVISIRHMQATAAMRKSFINFIFTTNDHGVLPIQDGDRRINVAPRQETKLIISDAEVAAIKSELPRMSAYLAHYEVDQVKARTPLENEAKESLRVAARNSIDEFFYAVHSGDLQFFIDGTQEDSNEYGAVAEFKAAVDQWIEDAKAGRVSQITVAQLKAAHVVMCRDKGMKTPMFKAMASHRNHPAKKLREGDDRWFGWCGDWKLTQEQLVDLKGHLRVVPTNADLAEKVKSEIKPKES
jgi:hypothetical protein